MSGLQAGVTNYNKSLAAVDAQRTAMKRKEAAMRDLLERCLSAVAGRFGKDSAEYAQAGGTRKSDRKRHGQAKKEQAARASRKAKGAAPAVTPSVPESPVGTGNGAALPHA